MSLVIAMVAAASSLFFVVLWISWKRNNASLNVSGRYVLITGCDCGIGRETAIRLDKMGVRVLATCLTKEGEQSLKSVASNKLKTFQMDVTDSQQIKSVFEKVKDLLDQEAGKILNSYSRCSALYQGSTVKYLSHGLMVTCFNKLEKAGRPVITNNSSKYKTHKRFDKAPLMRCY